MNKKFLQLLMMNPDGGGSSGGGAPDPGESNTGAPGPNEPQGDGKAEGDTKKDSKEPEKAKTPEELIKAKETELADQQKLMRKQLEEFENLKKDRDGQSRKVQAMRKEIEDLQKKHMTDEEKAIAERKRAEEERAEQERIQQETFLKKCVDLAATASKIEEEDKFLITAPTQEEIFKKSERLAELLAQTFEKGKVEGAKSQIEQKPPPGSVPAKGSSVAKTGNSIIDSLNAATEKAMKGT